MRYRFPYNHAMKIETHKMTEAELIRALGNAEAEYRQVTATYSDFHAVLSSFEILTRIQLYRTELEKRSLEATI